MKKLKMLVNWNNEFIKVCFGIFYFRFFKLNIFKLIVIFGVIKYVFNCYFWILIKCWLFYLIKGIEFVRNSKFIISYNSRYNLDKNK